MKAFAAACVVGSALAFQTGAGGPAFPDSWSANEVITSSQGGAKGVSYFDKQKQRTALVSEFDVSITDYKANGGQGKQYSIRVYADKKGGPLVRHCEGWCDPSVPEVCDNIDRFVATGKYFLKYCF
jgi:hypothetical protein